jgi:hypothetical protein
MKHLSDTEILNWNKRLEKSDYSVYPISNFRSANPDIIFRKQISNTRTVLYSVDYGSDGQFVETLDPFILYDFTFSIASNRREEFFDLFEKLSKEDFGTKSVFRGNYPNGDEKLSDIHFDDEIIKSKEESTHIFSGKKYDRFTYHFSGKLGSIMAYISYLEDSINYFSEIWGYDEDGTEVCLVKYPIGGVVSKTSDKSVDYLILDYNYRKSDNKYYIDFITSEIKNVKGSTITYGDICTFRESDLCYSRNNRINNILN